MSRPVLTATLAATALLSLPASVLAAPDFSRAVDIDTPVAEGGPPRLAFQEGGRATAARVAVDEASPPSVRIELLRGPARGPFTRELNAPVPAGELATRPTVAVAPNGAAVAAWIEVDPDTSVRRHRATYRPAGSTAWEPPTTLSPNASDPVATEAVEVAIAPTGLAAVVLTRSEAPSTPEPGPGQPDARVDVAVHPAAGGFSGLTRVSTANRSATGTVAAFDDAGNLTIAYEERVSEGTRPDPGDDRAEIVTRRRPVSNGLFTDAERVSGSFAGVQVSGLQLAVAPSGAAAMTWRRFRESANEAQPMVVTRGSATAPWSAAPGLPAGTSVVSLPLALAITPSGTAYVLVLDQAFIDDCIRMARIADGTARASNCLTDGEQSPAGAHVAAQGEDAVAVWSESTSDRILATSWSAGAEAPERARPLDDADPSAELHQLVPDGDGSVVALWSASGRFRAAARDGGAPRLDDTAVPSAAIVGAPVTLRASASDPWSSLAGPVLWDLGDGTAVEGDVVTHTFAAPGPVTVTARTSDALGNARARSFTVNVAPAAPATPPPPAPPVPLPAPAAGSPPAAARPAPAARRCVVPRIRRGSTLTRVRASLRKAGCRPGKTVKTRSKTRRGRVVSIRGKAGAKRALNARVTIVVSAGRKR